MNTLKQLAHTWIDAFNTHNLDLLLSLYHDEAEHYSPKLKIRQPHTNGIIKGKTALKNWWADAFMRLPQLHYQLLQLTIEENRVFMEYIRQTPSEPDLQVGEILHFEHDKISASRVYHS